MLLAIDIGNTNVVFALMDGRKIVSRWRIATDPRRTADEYAVWLHQLMALESHERSAVEAVIVATVVPRALHNIEVLASKYFATNVLVAGRPPVEFGIAIDLPEPESVGADRIVNAIAAHAAHEGDLIIIDFGTATTFDVVDYNGSYKGGVIAPGINLSLDALVAAAAKLPRIAIEAPSGNMAVIGRSTEEAMRSGIYWGYVAMIEGMVARIAKEIGRKSKVIATGGMAALFSKHSNVFDAIEPDLTVTGLGLLYERSKS
jgi:type III pantothenate kinase